ncbi:hypothetical protein MMC15_008343 [Xylographa vitiligo]|nr:hypothetical protein [Xylographa vitiligo]
MRFSQILLATFSLAALASTLPNPLSSSPAAHSAEKHSHGPLPPPHRRDLAHHSDQPRRREAIPMSSAEAAAFNEYLESIPQLRRRSAAKSMSTGQNLSVMSVRPPPKSLQAQLRRRLAAKAAGSPSSSTALKPGASLKLPKQQGCDGCVLSAIPASLRGIMNQLG